MDRQASLEHPHALLAASLLTLAVAAGPVAANGFTPEAGEDGTTIVDEVWDEEEELRKHDAVVAAFVEWTRGTDRPPRDVRRAQFERFEHILSSISWIEDSDEDKARTALRRWLAWALDEHDAWLVYQTLVGPVYELEPSALERLAGHTSPSVRRRIARVLSYDEALVELRRARILGETEPRVRASLLHGFAEEDQAWLIPHCLVALTSDQPTLVGVAITCVTAFDAREADAMIAKLLKTASGPMLAAIVSALDDSYADIGPATAERLRAIWAVESAPCIRRRLMNLLTSNELPLDPWTALDLMWDDDPSIVGLALDELVSEIDDDVFDAVRLRARVGDPRARVHAVWALGQSDDPRADAVLFTMLSPGQPGEIQTAALGALENIRKRSLADRGPGPQSPRLENIRANLVTAIASPDLEQSTRDRAGELVEEIDSGTVKIVISCGFGRGYDPRELLTVRGDDGSARCLAAPGGHRVLETGARLAPGVVVEARDRFDDGRQSWYAFAIDESVWAGGDACWVPEDALEPAHEPCASPERASWTSHTEFDVDAEWVDRQRFRALVDAGLFDLFDEDETVVGVRFDPDAIRPRHLDLLRAAGPWTGTPVARVIAELARGKGDDDGAGGTGVSRSLPAPLPVDGRENLSDVTTGG